MTEAEDIPQPKKEPSEKFGATLFEIPVLPLTNTTLFPETMVPLSAGRPASMAAVEAALASEEKLLACISVRPDRSSDEDAKPEDLFEVGTLVMIKRMERLEDTLHLIVQGTNRIRVLRCVSKDFLTARVEILPELETKDSAEVEATTRNLQALLQEALAYLPQVPPEVRTVVLSADSPIRLAYFLGSILSLGVEKEQELLEANTSDVLIHLAHNFLAHEVEIIKLRSKIATEAQHEMDKAQRDYVLRMQMKAIQKELGEDDHSPQGTKAIGSRLKIFVGHGRNPIWSRVVSYLKDELELQVEAFETSSRASEHIVDVLKGFLDICDAAVIVMTADDKTAEGTARARQNVIHEIGLCQGRFGFDRVILLQQVGTEDFSNIAGLQTLRFNERIEEGFYDLGRAVRKLQHGRTVLAHELNDTPTSIPLNLSQYDG